LYLPLRVLQRSTVNTLASDIATAAMFFDNVFAWISYNTASTDFLEKLMTLFGRKRPEEYEQENIKLSDL
jgi:hypothetical protein